MRWILLVFMAKRLNKVVNYIMNIMIFSTKYSLFILQILSYRNSTISSYDREVLKTIFDNQCQHNRLIVFINSTLPVATHIRSFTYRQKKFKRIPIIYLNSKYLLKV